MKKYWKWSFRAIAILAISLVPVASSFGQDMPEMVELDSLTQLFESVSFDHQMHLDVEIECSVCHHHTTGTGVSDQRCVKCHDNADEVDAVACRDCHTIEPFSAAYIRGEDQDQYHIDKPGLKGAYHLNCMGCHEEMGGPLGCEDCHERNDTGDAFFNAGKYAPVGHTLKGYGH